MFAKLSIAAALMLPATMLLSAQGASAAEVKWPRPPTGYNQASASIPKGTLTGSITYATRNYGNRPMRVYTPPGYSATRAEKYPVMYLHHGIGGNENAWVSSEGSADKVMDFLYAQTSLNVTPMIVVMPHGKSVSNGGNETFAQFEDILLKDLIPHIERTYNASPDPVNRAIAGLSMGGGQTLNHGYKNPTVFSWIGAFSPAPNTTAAGTTIKDMPAVKANIRLNFLAAGTNESGYLNTARNYHNYLNTNGVTNLYLQVEEGVGHEPENWNRQLHNFAQRIFKGTTTNIQLAAREKARAGAFTAGTGRTGSRFLVGRSSGTGMALEIFSLDGRAIPSRSEAPALPASTILP